MRLMKGENTSLRETMDVLSNATEKGSQSDKSKIVGRNKFSGDASFIPGKVIGVAQTTNATSIPIGMLHY
jgi:hypothetical protein